MKLLRTLILRPLGRDPLRTALTILSVALGVAVVVAIDLAGDAATGSFRSSMETLAGKTDLEIIANGGVDERWIGRLAALPLDVRFAPAIETQAEIPGIGSVALYGVDLVASAAALQFSEQPVDPDRAIVVSQPLAKRLRVARKGSLQALLEGRPCEFRVAEIAPADSEFLALDIAAAQKALGRYGKLDRIDVFVAPGEDFASVEKTIRQMLPPGYLVEKPGSRNEENQRMLRAFRWNLRVLSYISLVVGAFLIYNTISVSVVRRRAEIGILRALGTSRWSVLRLFLWEALALGIAGAAIGVALGRLLASAMVTMIADTVNALYTTSRPAPVQLTAAEIWTGIIAGAAVALASAFAPAREAMAVAPVEAMGRGAHETRARLRWRRGLVWAALLAILAIGASQAAPLDGKPVGGYVASLFAIGAAAFSAPALVLLANRVSGAGVRRVFQAEGILAARSLTSGLSRSSVVVSALATAIAMMASVSIMVGSFRETVQLWMETQLRADIYVRPVSRAAADQHPPLHPEIPSILASVPGIAAIDLFHAFEIHYHGERATLGAGNVEIVRRYGRLRFLPGEDRDAILRSLPGRDRAIVSEPFALKHALQAGSRISVPLGGRNLALDVAGVYYDYSSSQGWVILDRSTLLKYLPGQPATNAAIYVLPGANARDVAREIQLRTAGRGVSVALNQALRRDAMSVFDRTFAITWALEAVAIVVAMLGAANSLLALVLDRRREMGLLRYLGASAAQLRRMILLEAGFLGLLAEALGLALGFALSLLLIYVVNKQSFGWTIQFHPPVALIAGALLLVWCVTVMAGFYPARVASRLNPIDVIHEE
jgi:putative ABC transport system permease protein